MRYGSSFLKLFVPNWMIVERRQYLAYCFWKDRGFSVPCPQEVKLEVLLRNGGGDITWIETGTFHGETTQELARDARMVYTIEPSPQLFAKAVDRFAGVANVECLNGLSEDLLPGLLPRIESPVSFWLDGHYSAGETFKGPVDTPIGMELEVIERHLTRWEKVSVLIDDVRCFAPESPEYPPLDFLVDWSRKNGLRWHIEHDIFVASKR